VPLSTPAIPGSALQQERRSRLRWAVIASLLLHLLLGYLLEALPAAAGRGGTQPPAAMLATLRVPPAPAAAATAEAAAESPTPPQVPATAVEQPAADTAGDAGEAATPSSAGRQVAAAVPAMVAALGERRLAAERPPYLAAVLALPPAADSWYFPRRELTLPPVLQDEPLLRPPAGSSPGRGGRVLLRVLIAADGAVDRVEVLGSGVPAGHADAAVAAFAGLRFRPGEIEGVAVRSEARFAVDFDEAAAGSSHVSDRVGVQSPRPRGSAPPVPQPAAAGR
jgi:protein TonB